MTLTQSPYLPQTKSREERDACTLRRQLKLTPTMCRVLTNIAQGRHAGHGFPAGRSHAGGLSGTIPALYKRGLIGRNGELTAAGRKAVAGLNPKEA